ncbi:MAG: signal peptidase I [SAR324 cluster bacterium]|nr:signal peptidase I [SAR324 cluster bacterium]
MRLERILKLDRFIKNKTIREWVEALIFALVFAGIFRTWAYSPYNVPTGSMIHTIEIGDYLFADMHAYGYVVPFTDIKFFPSKIERGDVVIFPSPHDPSIPYIKRVVAIEGDEVELVGEEIYINGQVEKNPHRFLDQRLPMVSYNGEFAVPEKFTVPAGQVWPLGDNRRNSLDGRFWGFINVKDVRAKGLIVVWSHNPQFNFFSGYRFERIGQFLE